MAYVKVPKDLTGVKTKVALNLTKRQLIGFSSAALIGFPVYTLSKNFFEPDISMIFMSIVILPILFCTLYEKDGLPFEKHFSYIYEFYKSRKIRVYKTDSLYKLNDVKKAETTKKSSKTKKNIAEVKTENQAKRRNQLDKR